MTWIRKDTYLPEGVEELSYLRESHPRLVIAEHRFWSMVREEIEGEAPDHPVVIKAPMSALYGSIFRGYEFRHVDWSRFPRLGEWEEQVVRCRIRQEENQ